MDPFLSFHGNYTFSNQKRAPKYFRTNVDNSNSHTFVLVKYFSNFAMFCLYCLSMRKNPSDCSDTNCFAVTSRCILPQTRQFYYKEAWEVPTPIIH